MKSLSVCDIEITPKMFYNAELEVKKVLEVDCLRDFCTTDLYLNKYVSSSLLFILY